MKQRRPKHHLVCENCGTPLKRGDTIGEITTFQPTTVIRIDGSIDRNNYPLTPSYYCAACFDSM